MYLILMPNSILLQNKYTKVDLDNIITQFLSNKK
jgi:hypothetical protein